MDNDTFRKLSRAVSVGHGVPAKVGEKLIRNFLKSLKLTVLEGERVRINHFGTFERRWWKSRKVAAWNSGNRVEATMKAHWHFCLHDSRSSATLESHYVPLKETIHRVTKEPNIEPFSGMIKVTSNGDGGVNFDVFEMINGQGYGSTFELAEDGGEWQLISNGMIVGRSATMTGSYELNAYSELMEFTSLEVAKL